MKVKMNRGWYEESIEVDLEDSRRNDLVVEIAFGTRVKVLSVKMGKNGKLVYE